ncbi:hypothetical protein N0V90_010029 [Kalmusia sp. IMI 367209]|nr:hypothetical protein N0V90_010029 [Kalmusia sp. IMI 367209]
MAENDLPRDLYADLGLSPAATSAQVKAAFYRLAKEHHPDKKGPEFNGDASEFRKAREAYEKLSDATFKEQYDEKIFRKNSNEDTRPFNAFNPRPPHNAHGRTRSAPNPYARYHYTATEFTEEQPEFKNKDKFKYKSAAWESQHSRSYSSPQQK